MKNQITAILGVTIAILGCVTGIVHSHEIAEVCEDTEKEVELTIEEYLGLWKSKDGNFEVEITEGGFRYVDDEGDETIGEFTLLKDKLWLGRPDDDGAYVEVTGRGKIIMKQEGLDWELEFMKVE